MGLYPQKSQDDGVSRQLDHEQDKFFNMKEFNVKSDWVGLVHNVTVIDASIDHWVGHGARNGRELNILQRSVLS